MEAKKNIFLTVLILFFLQGCAASVASSGAQAIYNRHNITATLNDQYVTIRAERSLYLNTDRYKDTHVSTSSFNGVVLLAGQTPSAVQRNEIETIVKQIDGVDEVHNVITIAKPASAITRMSDAWITSKIKAKLIAADDIDPSQIKVVTENGTVYLMGIIPHNQADIAVDLARSTDGVQNVVKVFKYLLVSRV